MFHIRIHNYLRKKLSGVLFAVHREFVSYAKNRVPLHYSSYCSLPWDVTQLYCCYQHCWCYPTRMYSVYIIFHFLCWSTSWDEVCVCASNNDEATGVEKSCVNVIIIIMQIRNKRKAKQSCGHESIRGMLSTICVHFAAVHLNYTLTSLFRSFQRLADRTSALCRG